MGSKDTKQRPTKNRYSQAKNIGHELFAVQPNVSQLKQGNRTVDREWERKAEREKEREKVRGEGLESGKGKRETCKRNLESADIQASVTCFKCT